MSKPNGRRVRMAEFKQQVADAVLPPDGMVVLELDEDGDDVIKFRVPLPMQLQDPDDEYVASIKAAESRAEFVELILGEEQHARLLAAGYSDDDFWLLFTEETNAAGERMRDFRYKPSGK